jgi:iron-sulfur cluster assembly protein/iron-sulfur cluster insertion protein
MITLTEKAARAVVELQRERAQAGQMLRLFVESGGCSGFSYGMTFAEPQPGDAVLEAHGVQFAVDAASLRKLERVEIDYDDGLGGRGFEIRNPNAHSTCGCGKSFN